MDKRIKCTACRRVKFEEDFKKNHKLLKTCITCREKNKKILSIEPEPVNKENEPSKISLENTVPFVVETTHVTPVPAPVPVTETVLFKPKWIALSGYWIKEGEEQNLHKKLIRRLNRQFHSRSAFSVHKYLTRWLRVDIRDRYTPSYE